MPALTRSLDPSADRLGSHYLGSNRCSFRVWSPLSEKVELHLIYPEDRRTILEPDDKGYHAAELSGVAPGTRYFYRLSNGLERPDPASRSQPAGVHGPTEVVDATYPWSDEAWTPQALRDMVFYELHVGTFSAEGTFAGAISHLDELRELGITAVELMPVAQFPGSRNWGYDGVCPFAAQDSYGGVRELKQLVNACHERGLSAVLDVVYNHLGPEGNYLGEFGPYFTERYKTPWGPAMNFDGPGSDEVRRFFIENALSWLEEFHFDALRLDAVHAIADQSAYPFLRELADEVRALSRRLGKPKLLIAESDLNDPRMVSDPSTGGYGLDAQWNDDFHHSLHALLTGEQRGYYAGFRGVEHLATVFRRGFLYTGQYSPYRGRRYGAPTDGLAATKFVVCAQNHDQVGNRMRGDRLSENHSFPALRLAAALTVLSPFLPLLFMGEEYGDKSPFQYFTSHSNPELVEAVREGRKGEFASFSWEGEVPDPHDEKTFERSKLDRTFAKRGEHEQLREFYRTLLELRRSRPALRSEALSDLEVSTSGDVLTIRRWNGAAQGWMIANFGTGNGETSAPELGKSWRRMIDSMEGSSTLPLLIGSSVTRLDLLPLQFAFYEMET